MGEQGELLACTASCVAAIHGAASLVGPATAEALRAEAEVLERKAWRLNDEAAALEDEANRMLARADRIEAAAKNAPTPLDWFHRRRRSAVGLLGKAVGDGG